MNFFKATFFGAVLTFGLAACNTTRGVGQDIEAAGESIKQAAQGAKERMDDDK